jgi:ABC-type sugar transport system ATPase subunit
MVAGEDVALDVDGLRMRYGTRDVLHGVTFQARRGQVVALLGPNGAGKTTTLEILEGFRMRSAGRVTVLGTDPAHGDEQWRARLGVVLQSWRDHGKWRVRELLATSVAIGAAMLAPPIIGLIAISGIFYPITALPHWLQWIGQVFPVYWLGLGMRSALLPDPAAVEIGGSWRHLETAGVLGAWAALGLLVAPLVLRRMARRESGSVVAERRERTLQRIG